MKKIKYVQNKIHHLEKLKVMKLFFALVFISITCDKLLVEKAPINNYCKFSLHIWNYNNSSAYTTYYKIDSDSINVTIENGIQGESDKIILRRRMKDTEKKSLYNFLLSFPIDRLDTIYKNPLVEDGDQKRIEISICGKRKTIDIENFYQKDLARLFNNINEFFEKDIQINYVK